VSDAEWLSVRRAAALLGVSPRRLRRAVAAGLVPDAEVVRVQGRRRVRLPRAGIVELRLVPTPLERRVRELTEEVAALRRQVLELQQGGRGSRESSLVPRRRSDDSRARTLLSEIDGWLRSHGG
jgi:DNA-binding transcriptional MerR regulator